MMMGDKKVECFYLSDCLLQKWVRYLLAHVTMLFLMAITGILAIGYFI